MMQSGSSSAGRLSLRQVVGNDLQISLVRSMHSEAGIFAARAESDQAYVARPHQAHKASLAGIMLDSYIAECD